MRKFQAQSRTIGFMLALGFVAMLPAAANGQQTHPKKRIFQNAAQWRTTSPGRETSLASFSPFRAVYDRTYRQAAGPNSGEVRNDRVIISAENVGWDGSDAVSITLIDSAVVEHRDTNARVFAMFVDKTDLSIHFEIGPIPGKAKDYYIASVGRGAVKVSQVETETQTLQPQTMRTNQRAFGPTVWAMASMNLQKGQKLNLGPNLGGGNVLTSTTVGHVVEEKTFTDGSGKEYQSWVIEKSSDLESAKVSHVYLMDKPPYYLGTESVDLDTGERRKLVWLRHVEVRDE